jgi:hypothetical protein
MAMRLIAIVALCLLPHVATAESAGAIGKNPKP